MMQVKNTDVAVFVYNGRSFEKQILPNGKERVVSAPVYALKDGIEILPLGLYIKPGRWTSMEWTVPKEIQDSAPANDVQATAEGLRSYQYGHDGLASTVHVWAWNEEIRSWEKLPGASYA